MKIQISFYNKLVIFCGALLFFRFLITSHYSFLFLFWNLFLAWLPLFLIRKVAGNYSKLKKTILLGLSILFLPNAPYILTDLFHLKKSLLAPLWLDLILILSFAFLGLFYFIMSFELILSEINRRFGKKVSVFFKPLLLCATAYGIYLGRYMRFNSWDIISDPIGLAKGVGISVFDKDYYKETFAVTITFTVFLYLVFEIYLSFRNKVILKEDELH